MIQRYLIVVLMAVAGLSACAQAPRSYSSADILQQMEQLKVLGSVLYVGAHPDDENTRLLAWLAKEKKVRAAYLSLTRGDGGQNLLGDEQGIELGLIRTQELLAARRIDGAEQFFSRAYDFGFSKSSDEALKIWGRDSILADVVWVIRLFQPDVIITRFPEDARAGHGHHSASSILAHEAFAAAADPTKFPEQFAYGVKPWQAKRILWNTFNFGGANTTSPGQFHMDVGAYNALLGKSYGEIASESRSQHKSQGFGIASSRGQSTEFFLTTAGDPPVSDLLDGVDTDWSRIGAADVNAQVDSLITGYDTNHPAKSLPALERLTARVQALPMGYWRNYKLTQLHHLENECSGLYAEAYVTHPYLVRGEEAYVTVYVINRGPEPITITHLMVGTRDTTLNMLMPSNQPLIFNTFVPIPTNAPLTQPYWLEDEKSEGRFTVGKQTDIGKPQNEAPLLATIGLSENGSRDVILPVQYKHTDPVRGELYQPLEVVPSLLVYFQPDVILDNLEPPFHPQLKVTVVPTTHIFARNLSINVNNGKNSYIVGKGKQDLEKDKSYEFDIPYNESYMKSARGTTLDVSVIAEMADSSGSRLLGSGTYGTGLTEINYQHIPFIHYFHGTVAKVIGQPVKIKGKNIGYIMGAGDKLPGDLELMGYEVTLLKEQDLQRGNLSRFDAIITGVRAFNTQPWLKGVLPRLMDYVKEGGVLLEQYNNPNGIGGLQLGPYPFRIGGGRVTDETAAVNFIDPASPALHYPNEITASDFEGWVQERGLYYLSDFDPAYAAVLSMSDPGESPQRGALITANYGRGKFVYTSLAFFRQLPAGVPGAYRLLANLLAKPPVK